MAGPSVPDPRLYETVSKADNFNVYGLLSQDLES